MKIRRIEVYRSAPVEHHPEHHGIRCEFRRLVNSGKLRLCQYKDFVKLVDESGSVAAAMARVGDLIQA